MVKLPRRGQRGYTLLEIMVGLTVLGLALFSFTAYAQGQRKALNRSKRLVDGTRAAASALQVLKGQLADSAAFAAAYDGTGSHADVRTLDRDVNGMRYSITLTLTRAPAPLYGIKARARATWDRGHSVELGMLCPGATGFL
jgi:prepilin-type N-terminal cleavage/methylation domain-containing protein